MATLSLPRRKGAKTIRLEISSRESQRTQSSQWGFGTLIIQPRARLVLVSKYWVDYWGSSVTLSLLVTLKKKAQQQSLTQIHYRDLEFGLHNFSLIIYFSITHIAGT